MAVKMRLTRMGKKKSPFYRIVVIDGRKQRDGRYIDLIGRYDPREDPSIIEIDEEKAVEWLKKGVQPTEAVAKLLAISGVTSKYKVASGRIHTVGAEPQATEADVDTTPPADEDVAAEDAAAEPIGESAAEEPTSDEVAEDADDSTSEEE